MQTLGDDWCEFDLCLEDTFLLSFSSSSSSSSFFFFSSIFWSYVKWLKYDTFSYAYDLFLFWIRIQLECVLLLINLFNKLHSLLRKLIWVIWECVLEFVIFNINKAKMQNSRSKFLHISFYSFNFVFVHFSSLTFKFIQLKLFHQLLSYVVVNFSIFYIFLQNF